MLVCLNGIITQKLILHVSKQPGLNTTNIFTSWTCTTKTIMTLKKSQQYNENEDLYWLLYIYKFYWKYLMYVSVKVSKVIFEIKKNWQLVLMLVFSVTVDQTRLIWGSPIDQCHQLFYQCQENDRAVLTLNFMKQHFMGTMNLHSLEVINKKKRTLYLNFSESNKLQYF